MRLTMANVNTHSNIDILPQSETASYTSMNSSTPSSVTTSRSDGSGSTNFHIDFNESILQVHKRSPLYIIGDRAQRCVSLYRCNTINTWDYITKVNRESVRYYNFLYSPSNDNYVLRSAYKMCSFDIWNFYLNDTFEMGCPCNLDIALAKHYEYLNNAESRQRSKCISAVYDDINICLSDFFNEIVSHRYYDTSDDQTAKGVILLADVVEILPCTSQFSNALR
ncbi:unnamed protein product [Rotaria sp. Silwood2]|nr:unnamed protein product [Rotaria sp. Silwood2]CAF4359327.1 unnamed protein product [Rotaria sp. Silwood2]